MVKPPSVEQMRAIASHLDLVLSEAELVEYVDLIGDGLGMYKVLDQLQPSLSPPNRSPTWSRRPPREENAFGAWYQQTSIKLASGGGLLDGKRVVLKDNVCLAGVPMMNGSTILEGYVPDCDATVVTRVLQAGGEIVGKAVCEHLSSGGSSFTADTGIVLNPYDPRRSAGGSSSGCAVLIARGEADMAIGADQGGSVRVPSSWCGVVGMKPTFGLVPYTGIMPGELTLDHAGPMASSVEDVALLLQVIAGEDGVDVRQRQVPKQDCIQALKGEIRGIRLGVVDEGFAWPGASEPDVDAAVEVAAAELSTAGAEVRHISIPMHREAVHIWNAIALEGGAALLGYGNGMAKNVKGPYMISLVEAFARGRASHSAEFSPIVKLRLLFGQYMHDVYHGRYYAQAQNLIPTVRNAYDEALRDVDCLVLPTTPMKASLMPEVSAPLRDRIIRSREMLTNTPPFCATGHPAISVPCAQSNGLPVGMMLVGRHWEDALLLQVAYRFEQLGAFTRPTLASVSEALQATSAPVTSTAIRA